MSFDLKRVIQGYENCVQWLSQDDEDLEGSEGWSAVLIEEMKTDCAAFIAAIPDDLAEAISEVNYSDERLGHDFWLTRNHHGAGFWDREELECSGPEYERLTAVMIANRTNPDAWNAALDERNKLARASIGARLTVIARGFGEVSLYVGDDKLEYAA